MVSFVTDVKKYLADTVLCPTGILGLCSSMSVNFNGGSSIEILEPAMQLQLLLTASNPYLMSKNLSGCMLKQDVLPDYALDESADDITVIEKSNEKRLLRRTNAATNESPFTGVLQTVDGVRMPAYRHALIPGSDDEFYLFMDLETFIPSTLFNTSDDSKFSFYGIENFSLNLHLRTSYGRLLSQKYAKTNLAGTAKDLDTIISIKSMEFVTPPEMRCRIITPPTYMSDKMIDPSTNAIRDYTIGYSCR